MVDRIGKQLGNYTLTQFLGKGGFAEVYLGRHVYLNTNAAIKVLHMQLASGEQENFLKEARLIASLVHRNIVRVLDFGVDDGTPFLVMDYAPNGTLRQIHPRGTILPLLTVVIYAQQIAEGLHYAHKKKLIHRDVKPENLLVGANDEILLSDFGTALVVETIHNQSLVEMSGTVTYMAPEQIQGKPRLASDQYGLAVVIYEWLTGGPPFRGSFTELFTQHMFTTPLPLREKSPNVPLDVEKVILMALSKDPDKRFGSVKAFANALEQATFSARPPSVPLPQPPAAATGEKTEPLPPYGLDGSDTSSDKREVVSEPIRKEPVVSEPLSGGGVITLVPSSSVLSTQASTLPVRKRRISRRAALFGLTGLGVVGAATGGYLLWPRNWLNTGRQTSSPTPTISSPNQATSQPLYTYVGHKGAVNAVAWSPDGIHIISGSTDHTAQVWSTAGGSSVFNYDDGDIIHAVTWSPDGHYFAFGGSSREIPVYDANTSKQIYLYSRHFATVYAVAFSPDSQHIASGDANPTVRVWMPTNGSSLPVYRGHSRTIQGVAWSPNSKYIASASGDRTVHVWEASSGKRLFIYRGHTGELRAVTWSPDGTRIASAGLDGTIQVYSATNGKFIMSANDPSGTVFDVMWSPNGKYIASANKNGTVRIWDAATLNLLSTYRPGNTLPVYTVRWSPDSKYFASGGADSIVRVWQTLP